MNKMFLNTKRVTGTNEKGDYNFLSFYTYNLNHDCFQVKFTKEARKKIDQLIELESGVCYDLVFDPKKANYDKKSEYPTIWLSDIERIEIHIRNTEIGIPSNDFIKE